MKLKAAISKGLEDLNIKQLSSIKKNFGLTETELKFIISQRDKYGKNTSELLRSMY